MTRQSAKFATITVFLVFGGFLFGGTRAESYILGIGVGLALVFLYGLAQEMEVR
ncbi:MAG: hypothetical protein ACO3RU_13635 [Planctomycetota bacterium]